MFRVGCVLVFVLAACGKGEKKSEPEKKTEPAKTEPEKKAEPATTEPAKPEPPKPAACADKLTITIDGKPVADLKPGVSFTGTNEGYRTEMVEVSTKARTCADVIPNDPPATDGEIRFTAFGGPAQGVLTDAYTELSAKTTVSAKPTGKDTPMSICVQPVSFTPNAGMFSGKKIEVSGTFTGNYCGDKKM